MKGTELKTEGTFICVNPMPLMTHNDMSESAKRWVINAEAHSILPVVKVEHVGSMKTEIRIKVSKENRKE